MFIQLTNDFGKTCYIRPSEVTSIDVVLHPRDNIDLDKFVTRVSLQQSWILVLESPEDVCKMVVEALDE